jgi:parallel beta-helix repeat protein
MKRFASVLVAFGASAMVLGATSAFGATHTVGCGGASFPSIQLAVNGSGPGDTINVCSGTYTEQVSIPAGKNGLTLQSVSHAATIQAPGALSAPKAIVRVTGSQNVKISDFTIQGPGDGGCDSLEYGIRIDGGGSALVTGNHITHIRDNPFSGCQNGVAIQAGRAQDSTSGSVTAKSNTIDDFQKNGITVSGTGSTGTIGNNTIVGAGPTSTIAQNGIQVSGGASASVTNNDVSGESYTPAGTTSTGILVFGPVGATTISNNNVHAAQTGIYVFSGDLNTTVSSNTVSGASFDGITIDSSNRTTVASNSVSNSDQGIALYNTQQAMIRVNTITGSHTNGLFADSDTVANIFQNNSATGTAAGGFDCRDNTSASASTVLNTWKRNTGNTSSPAGLCTAAVGSTTD